MLDGEEGSPLGMVDCFRAKIPQQLAATSKV